VEEKKKNAAADARPKNSNNSSKADQFQSVEMALERSTPVNEILVLDHQNPANIDVDTIVLVIMI
jgi:hypothetical protein